MRLFTALFQSLVIAKLLGIAVTASERRKADLGLGDLSNTYPSVTTRIQPGLGGVASELEAIF